MSGKRGIKISLGIQDLITRQTLLSKKKRGELAIELRQMIESNGWYPPTIATLEKMISRIRNHKDKQYNILEIKILQLEARIKELESSKIE